MECLASVLPYILFLSLVLESAGQNSRIALSSADDVQVKKLVNQSALIRSKNKNIYSRLRKI